MTSHDVRGARKGLMCGRLRVNMQAEKDFCISAREGAVVKVETGWSPFD